MDVLIEAIKPHVLHIILFFIVLLSVFTFMLVNGAKHCKTDEELLKEDDEQMHIVSGHME